MPPLRRHRLAYLTDAGWAAVLDRSWDPQARACLSHWAGRRLPLVVTCQRVASPLQAVGDIALGLPAPAPWARRRLPLQVLGASLLCFDEFPNASEVQPLLSRTTRVAWRVLSTALADCGTSARVYGSYGWQRISGLDYLHADSDLDVWIAVDDAEHADRVASLLRRFEVRRPRLDGELVFPDGAAVAWREWAAWRAGGTRGVLVKRLHGAAIEHRFGEAVEQAA